MRAAGFTLEATIEGESWKRRMENGGRFVDDRNPIGDKKRWSAGQKLAVSVPRVELALNDWQGMLFADPPVAGDPTDG